VTISLGLLISQSGGGDGVGDQLTGIENLVGSAHGDTLGGDAGHNRLDGGLGEDLLEGGAGADTLVGGADVDTASYAASPAGVTIQLHLVTPQISGGDGDGDALSTIENLMGSTHDDWLSGNGAANLLIGVDGADSLFGANRADTLVGGAGADTLRGGNEADIFVFLLPSDGDDRVLDFLVGTDLIAVRFIGSLPGGLPEAHFKVGLTPTATGSLAQLIWETDAKILWFDSDGDGPETPIQLARFINMAADTNLTAADIVVL
jgi:Ca2+-binding RTX toxin-like protein